MRETDNLTGRTQPYRRPDTLTSRGASDLTPHEAAALLPPLSDAEYARLLEDIRRRGQREPIRVRGLEITDGRHRARACAELGLEPIVVEAVEEDPLETVVTYNLARRQLSKSQLAAVGALLEERLAPEARRRQRRHGGTAPGRRRQAEPPAESESPRGEARVQAARMVGVSDRYISLAKRIRRADRPLFEAVWRGEVGLSDALRRLGAERAAAAGPAAMPADDVAADAPEEEAQPGAEAAAADPAGQAPPAHRQRRRGHDPQAIYDELTEALGRATRLIRAGLRPAYRAAWEAPAVLTGLRPSSRKAKLAAQAAALIPQLQSLSEALLGSPAGTRSGGP